MRAVAAAGTSEDEGACGVPACSGDERHGAIVCAGSELAPGVGPATDATEACAGTCEGEEPDASLWSAAWAIALIEAPASAAAGGPACELTDAAAEDAPGKARSTWADGEVPWFGGGILMGGCTGTGPVGRGWSGLSSAAVGCAAGLAGRSGVG
mmetsp:Transcript_73888/g.216822  ORF Transcript_73888/g.216822 Transcript_73888/m.216822 type:complete len:154 (-) Transcript_73888:202-663(-)